jgi:hypothetical protein
MPFYHFGSEVYSVSGNTNSRKISMIYSYYYSLPMLSAYLTRISIPESKKIISMLAPTIYKKDLEKDIISDNPFLIIETNEEKSKYEKAIIKRSEFSFSLNGVNFYKILPKDLFKYTAKKDIAYFDKDLKNELFYKNGFYLSDTTKYYYFNDFEEKKSNIKYLGEGSGSVKKHNENVIIEFPSETFKQDKVYNLSLWTYNAGNNLNEHFRFGLIEYNQNGVVSDKEFYPEYSQLINGDWSLVEFDFKIKDAENNIKLYSKGSVYSSGNIYYDNLFVVENSLKVFKVIKQQNGKTNELFFNNNILK